jgi:hypothetical protein
MISDTMLSMILAQISTLQDRVDAHDERFVDTDIFIGNVMRLQTLLDVLDKHIEALEGVVKPADMLLRGLKSRVEHIELWISLHNHEDSEHINTLADSLITSKLMQLALAKRLQRIESHLGLTVSEDSDA